MKKIYLGVAFLYLSVLGAFAQTDSTENSLYKNRKLKVEEANFVSSYYHQEGNNSAVTGGIGTEKLSDFANSFDVTLTRFDKTNRLHTFDFEFGVDHYTSASSDKIDPTTISSASAADTRIYPSVNWSVKDDIKHYSFGAGASYSQEYDYSSIGGNINFSKFSKDNNRELGIKLMAFLDSWKVIYPIELRGNLGNGGYKPRNSFNASFSLSQIINTRLQMSMLLDLAYQQGQLGTLYQRVYFRDNSVHAEKLPESRFKIPLGLRLNYFAGDRFIIRSLYRFYTDDWGINAHSIEMEAPYKITPFFSLSPFYRYYTQTSADQFAGFQQHTSQHNFYSSDYDLSKFTSQYAGLNLRFTSTDGILGMKKFNTFELRYGHYNRSNGLNSNNITLALKFK
ncbi:DUF3570 domain-containing protein [Daejeonella oryzae]|uniref:DUF3570 domain-containing protein n=1 Tax=Daejeonella oryzae TaxID=1122943 RepID=UPI0004152B42|nr:DUF3570 domain-containing protein [Daejeonella oryzae]